MLKLFHDQKLLRNFFDMLFSCFALASNFSFLALCFWLQTVLQESICIATLLPCSQEQFSLCSSLLCNLCNIHAKSTVSPQCCKHLITASLLLVQSQPSIRLSGGFHRQWHFYTLRDFFSHSLIIYYEVLTWKRSEITWKNVFFSNTTKPIAVIPEEISRWSPVKCLKLTVESTGMLQWFPVGRGHW